MDVCRHCNTDIIDHCLRCACGLSYHQQCAHVALCDEGDDEGTLFACSHCAVLPAVLCTQTCPCENGDAQDGCYKCNINVHGAALSIGPCNMASMAPNMSGAGLVSLNTGTTQVNFCVLSLLWLLPCLLQYWAIIMLRPSVPYQFVSVFFLCCLLSVLSGHAACHQHCYLLLLITIDLRS